MDFLNKITASLEKVMVPIATKIEANKYISSIKNGMISLMAVLMVGSFSLIFAGLGDLIPEGTAIKLFFEANSELFYMPFNFTFGLFSIYATVAIAYQHTKKIGTVLLHPMIGSLIAVMIINTKTIDGVLDTGFLDSRGLLPAIITTFLVVEFMDFAYRKKITIRIKGLPDMVANTFESIFPLLIVTVVASISTVLIKHFSGGQILPEIFTTVLAPAVSGIDSGAGVFIIILLEMIFWFFGLNGYAILIGFTLPFMTQYYSANAQAFAAGLAIPHIFTEPWWGMFAACTGSGITASIAILGLTSKNKQLKAAGKAAIIPAMFNISEPVVYGFPVAFNPYFFIPFVILTPIQAVIQFYIFKAGFIRPTVATGGGLPTPFAQYLLTLDWKAPFYAIGVILVGILMYYPFFKMYERSLDAKVDTEEFEKYENLDLDF